MNARLARLERHLRHFTGGTCTTCCGDPFAVFEQDAAGGPRLRPGQEGRLTPNLRCRGCGRVVARRVLLVFNVPASLPGDLRAS
jgi:hypothetical protein